MFLRTTAIDKILELTKFVKGIQGGTTSFFCICTILLLYLCMENIYYVYAHYTPIDKIVFYIGVGKNNRVIDGGSKRNKEWKNKVYKNNGFLFEFLHKNITKEEALSLERKYIKEIGLENLTNIVGEDGNSTAFKKGQIPWNKGLTNCQSTCSKSVKHNGIIYESVNECIKKLNIGKTTFYRYKKKNKIEYVY